MLTTRDIPKDYTPPSWDEVFFQDVYKMASKSKDPRTKIGAVLVAPGNLPLMQSYNGIVMGVNDLPERMERPEKYF
jgi:dCMP deaminase